MDSAKSFLSNNRGGFMNVIFILAALLAIYYIYKFLFAASDMEITLLDSPIDANASTPSVLTIPAGNGVLSRDCRVKQGGVYTVSFWMYITSWDFRSGMAKSVLQISDSSVASNDLLTCILYPNEAKLMVRVYNDGALAAGDIDYTNKSSAAQLFSGGGNLGSVFTPSNQMPVCDVQDIDLQRWINITVSVNGRIVDVYYDGKLSRSCVLPGVPNASNSGTQAITIGRNGGFLGKISGVQFFGYPLTPDRIYAVYQIGPASSNSFIGFLSDKLGFNIKYSGYQNPGVDRMIAL